MIFLAAALACVGAPEEETFDYSVPSARVIEDFELGNWRHTRVGGFEVYTNASPESVHSSLVRLERFTSLVGNFIFGNRFVPPKATVYIFSKNEQFVQFSAEWVAGHAIVDRENASLAMYAGSTGAVNQNILNHELVHIILGTQRERNFPNWFDEGISVFFGPTTIRGDVATIGQRPRIALGRTPRHTRPLSLARLLGSETILFDDIERYYEYSWLFVHYGLLGEQLGGPDRVEEFWRYVALTGENVPWREAFSKSFTAPFREISHEFMVHRGKILNSRLSPQGAIVVEDVDPVYEFEEVEIETVARVLADHSIRIQDHFKLSASFLDVILDQRPTDANALHDRARIAAALQDFVLAQRLVDRLMSNSTSSPDRLMEITRAKIKHERFRSLDQSARNKEVNQALIRAARDDYRSVLDQNPMRFETWLALGDTFVLDEISDVDEGTRAFEQAIELDSQHTHQARLGIAKLLIRSDKFTEARTHLDYVIEAYAFLPEATEAKRLVRQYY
jgi:hypothetical protein